MSPRILCAAQNVSNLEGLAAFLVYLKKVTDVAFLPSFHLLREFFFFFEPPALVRWAYSEFSEKIKFAGLRCHGNALTVIGLGPGNSTADP